MDVARASGLSRTTISRIELGQGDLLTVRTLEQVATALGARVRCQLDWNGEAMDRLLDQAHARLVERIVRWLDRAGWQSAVKVSFNVFGERGSVDVLALHTPSGCLLVVEAKTVVPDLQAMLASLDRKARLGIRIAGEQGWKAVAVSRLLVISEDRTARRRVAGVEATLRRALPDRTQAVRAFVRAPDPRSGIAGLLFLSDAHHPVTSHRIVRTGSGSRAS
jgi:hypothetical protein